MNFGFTTEQELLRAEIRKFLDQNAPLEEVRRIVEEEPNGFSRNLWKGMADLGWVGLTIPEAYGGVGLGFETLVIALEETGRTLFPSPFISTVLAARAIELAGDDAQKERWLPGLADGSKIATLALLEESDHYDAEGFQLVAKPDGDDVLLEGKKTFVPDAEAADLIVVAFREGANSQALSLAVIEKDGEGVSATDHPSMDLTKRLGEIGLDRVRVSPDCRLGATKSAWPTIENLIATGATLVTAEMVGAAEGALQITSDFVKQRVQFDQPIGKYQGVKHPLAEMYVDIESFKSLVYYAAWCLDQNHEDCATAVSRAKAYASETFARVGIDGVQLHGGVGYTWEYDIQLYLKRSKWARPIYGDSDYHYERVAQLGGI